MGFFLCILLFFFVCVYSSMPVVIIYLAVLSFGYIKRSDFKGMRKDLFNKVFLFIVFNSLIYGLYTSEGFRTIVETILPPLKGWQFNRTIFFNPFLWYLEIVIITARLSKLGWKKGSASGFIYSVFCVRNPVSV
ncbi:DUF6044 family protein [Butyrivibrio sp. INlla21]|uniref:DUF6044 family protein n=1 Tax=Butyrivibrio sp. INlla21 TaxID=1520811 RepID=UPI0008E36E98|nr:DUF6044 family protein [Butyrivibrio sp. INlla21]SFU98370.1 hypothetical protein SAMN02910342_02739 [Butyrivibrio sp. INlla21]